MKKFEIKCGDCQKIVGEASFPDEKPDEQCESSIDCYICTDCYRIREEQAAAEQQQEEPQQ